MPYSFEVPFDELRANLDGFDQAPDYIVPNEINPRVISANAFGYTAAAEGFWALRGGTEVRLSLIGNQVSLGKKN